MNRVISKLLPLAAILLLPMVAQAQDTSSSIRGRILDESGNPLGGASVIVEDVRSGNERTYMTNSTGTFLAARLPVGGPYLVTINGTQSAEVGSIALGETYHLTINMLPPMEEIIATGRVMDTIETTSGPAATFSLAQMDSAVAFNRDIKDVYATDPRLNLDGFQTNCAGKHPRFNSITLDGVSHNDRFGLNSNGYSTATGMPFPYDAIQEVSVELAPYNVNYGGFSACNINAVTKSGSNEWEANAFYEYTSDSLINDELNGQSLGGESYKEEKMGFSVGGPIIRDRLFFFAAYEETDEPRFLSAGYAGSGNGEERSWLSQDQYNTVNDAAQALYGYDTGGQPGNGVQTTENYMLRVDWNITDSHDLAVIYNFYDGSQDRSSDSDSNEFEFANHFYNKGSESETSTVIFRSQWTDAFSTELFYTDTRMDDSQVTIGPKDVGDHQINVDGFNNVMYLGADDSRQANNLFTDSQLFKLSGQVLAGDHVMSFGYEREELQVFNIFVQHSKGGEWDYNDESGSNPAACDALDAQGRWDDALCSTSGIDKFVLGRPSRVFYGSAGTTNDPLDAAADYTNVLNAVFLQDEIYFPNSDFTLTAGLRFEWFTSDDTPNYNVVLSDAVGIRNDSGIDGLNVLMPRIGLNWGVREDLTLRGGVGLFSGGNPNVWLSNAWSRDGVTNVQPNIRYSNRGLPSILDGGIPLQPGTPGGQIPTELFDIVANTGADTGSTFFNNLIDPNYEQPREWKVSLGATWEMPWAGISADFDYMYTVLQKGVIIQDVSQEHLPGNDTLAGGPIYTAIPGAGQGNLMLTNAKNDGTAHVFSVVFNKSWDFGMDLMLGYAYTDAEDISPMSSFTASTSFDNLATNDINNPGTAPSNYNVRNRVTLDWRFSRDFWGDNTTRFTVIGVYSEGQPGSFTIHSEDVLQVDESFRHLLYVPTDASDPNVSFDPGFDQAAFFAWVDKKGFSPGFVGRNRNRSASSSRVDLRIDQELPLFVDDLKARLFVKIYNFTNMLNDDWGRINDSNFFSRNVVDVSGLTPEGAYIYESFSERSLTDLQTFSSLWEARLGIEINFR